MFWPARRLERLNIAAICRFHPDFKDAGFPVWFGDPLVDHGQASLEGSDAMPVGNRVVLIGMGERSTPQAVGEVARSLFAAPAKYTDAYSDVRVHSVYLLLLLLPCGSCTNADSYELAPHRVSFSVPVRRIAPPTDARPAHFSPQESLSHAPESSRQQLSETARLHPGRNPRPCGPRARP